MFLAVGSWAKESGEKKDPAPKAITTKNIDIPVDELGLLVKPLEKDELISEAEAWQELLRAKVEEVSSAEIAVKQKNREIEKAKEVKKEIDNAKESLDEVKEAAQNTLTDTTGEAAEKTVAAAENAQRVTESVVAKIEEAQATAQAVAEDETAKKALDATGIEASTNGQVLVSEKAVEAAQEAKTVTAAVTEAAKQTQGDGPQDEDTDRARKAEQTVAAADDAQKALHNTHKAVKKEVQQSTEAMADKLAGAENLENIGSQMEETANANAEVKTKILNAVADLRAERTALIDRLGVVLNELNAKLGKTPEGKDNEVVAPYRLYIDSVGGIKVDVSDKEAAWSTILGWVQSDEGGIRWSKNIAVFIATVFAFWVLGLILGKFAEKVFGIARSSSILLRNFVVHSVRRVTLFIGLIFGLAALEINIGPLLALIGAAGFVVAFALQNTLSNFASGIMIMLYKPFDVSDLVDVAGVQGVVRSMNLVTTTITTADNQIMVVPNNSIWGNIIINITGSEQRRIDLVFGIGYGDDIGHAQQVLADVVGEHPLVLDDPAPVIQVHELAESSVNFICRPWAKTTDYWNVYWDLTRMVKERFDAEGISIPFPQRDVHIQQEPQLEDIHKNNDNS
jgi:small conductance mechanosensitive channel